MKIIVLLFLILSTNVYSQVGIGTTSPDASSALDIRSNSAGLLIPRLTEIQKNAITSPANGLLIYQIDGEMGFWFYDEYIYEWLPFKNEYDCANGLVENENTFKLGGQLIENTEIVLNGKDFTLNSNSNSSDFIFKSNIGGAIPSGIDVVRFNNNGNLQTRGSNGVSLICSDYDKNVLRVGNENYNLLVDNGFSYDIGGNVGTIDYLAKFSRGGGSTTYKTRGNAIGIGSIEYLIDGESAIASSHDFLPIKNGFLDLGHVNNRWKDIYAVNGVIQTSDATLKRKIKPLKYGLKEIMKLNPVTYKWKDSMVGNTIKAPYQQELKIGLLAQDLLKVIPESVSTHHWKVLDEKNNTYVYQENDKLGVNYSEIIPVLIKAIQEQQQEIETLKKVIKKIEK